MAHHRIDAQGGIDLARWPSFTGLPCDAVVTLRHGGVSGAPYDSLNLGLHVGDDPALVIENRRRVATAVGIPLERFVFAAQTHSAEVAVVDERHAGAGALDQAGAIATVDALVTTSPGLVLTMMSADCTPLVLIDPSVPVLAVVHAGWRGTTAGIAAATVEAMRALGADPGRIVAGIGPGISAQRYEVGPEVIAAARQGLGDAIVDAATHEGPRGRPHFDAPTANRLALEACGIAPAAIEVMDLTTDDPRCFSDRRARPCGRLATLAWLIR